MKCQKDIVALKDLNSLQVSVVIVQIALRSRVW